MECEICHRKENECRIRKIKNMCLCPRHVTQWYRYGCFNDNTIYQPNEYIIHETYAEIVLKDRNCCIVGYAMIDLDDVEKCKQHKWHLRQSRGHTPYVIASVKGKENQKVHLHRFVLNYDGPLDIDHINRNGLDNRKSNLRVVTHQENAVNNGADGVKQVPSGRWQAAYCRDYKTIYIGTFDSKEEAMKARQLAIS